MTAPINSRNARLYETELKYPVFFEIIRNHKTHRLYGAWAAKIRAGEIVDDDMKEFEREKKNLMKILKEYTSPNGAHLCSQPGAVIMRVLWRDHLVRPE